MDNYTMTELAFKHGYEKGYLAGVASMKNGHWKRITTFDYFICSECSYGQNIASNYCPNCGTKMALED